VRFRSHAHSRRAELTPAARADTASRARSADSAQAFADEWGIAKAYEGYGKLAADPDVDIVYCGTITPLHREHVVMCIEAGKHVVVEKPMSLSVAESTAMYAAAEAKGVMLQEGMWSRFFPATEHARALIEEGAIGDVKFLQGDFGFSGMGQSAEDMAAKRALHNPSMSCAGLRIGPAPTLWGWPGFLARGRHFL
jgi:predicted dehydrogenase